MADESVLDETLFRAELQCWASATTSREADVHWDVLVNHDRALRREWRATQDDARTVERRLDRLLAAAREVVSDYMAGDTPVKLGTTSLHGLRALVEELDGNAAEDTTEDRAREGGEPPFRGREKADCDAHVQDRIQQELKR